MFPGKFLVGLPFSVSQNRQACETGSFLQTKDHFHHGNVLAIDGLARYRFNWMLTDRSIGFLVPILVAKYSKKLCALKLRCAIKW